MKPGAIIEILRKTVCLAALGTYAVCLLLCTLFFLGYSFEPLLGYPWRILIPSLLLRWIPVATFFRLWYRPVRISGPLRGCAVALSVVCVSLSYFLSGIAGHASRSELMHGFLEGTIDMWPAMVMLLTVKNRNSRLSGSLRDGVTQSA